MSGAVVAYSSAWSGMAYLSSAENHSAVSRRDLILTTVRLGGLAVRSWRDASSADRHWEATAIEGLVRATCRGCGRCFLHDLDGVAETGRMRLSRQSPTSRRRASGQCSAGQGQGASGQREPRHSRGANWAAITRQAITSPRRNSPSRGVAPTTTPNQRPRISQPRTRTSIPASSSRHSCHRSSRCTIPATAARCGRAPASRRAAIRTSAGVSTLTPPA
jgi:hypothetical protein